METPPPYNMPPQKKSKTGLIIGIVVGVIAICCILPIAGIGLFVKNMVPGAVGMVACGWAAEDSRDGILQYAADHDGKLPAAAKWQDDIKKYVKKISDTHKTEQKDLVISDGSGDFCDSQAKTTLSYNTQVAGKKLADIQNSGSVIVVFEVPGLGRNKSQKFAELDAKTSPKLIGSLPRGWVEQPLEGEAYLRNAQGARQPIPRKGKSGSNPFGGGN